MKFGWVLAIKEVLKRVKIVGFEVEFNLSDQIFKGLIIGIWSMVHFIYITQMKITTKALAILCFLLLINSAYAVKVSIDSRSDINSQIVAEQPEGPAIPYS